MTNLQKRWNKLFINAKETLLTKEFLSLEGRYKESHRFYHTLEHVVACLRHLDSLSDCEEWRLVEMAVWFHDVVYDPLKSDNEEKSALFAQRALTRLGVDTESVDRVMALIILTKHPSHPQSLGEKYLLDIDLSILGADSALYEKYEAWIRKEYRFVPGILYKKGRRKVLNSFLEQPSIYSTENFRDRYERVARVNLEKALSSL